MRMDIGGRDENGHRRGERDENRNVALCKRIPQLYIVLRQWDNGQFEG